VARLSIPHSDVVVDLLAQVRFAPRTALLKQADNAEALAGEIESGRKYPEDWLVFRVTGFAPDLAAPRVVVGETLLHDLSSLVEHLTEAAKLRVGDAAAAGVTAEELCARWGVTRRTIERYRRAGLIARRAIDESARGRVRLVFAAGAVAAFERRGGGPSARPLSSPLVRRSKHLTAEEKAAALAWAERFFARSKGACTLNQCASRLARRMGRSPASVRRLLASPRVRASHVLPDPGERMSRRDRAFALRAQRAGVALSRIAKRLGVSVPGVHRGITIARLEAMDGIVGTLSLDEMKEGSAAEDAAVASALVHPLVALDADAVRLGELVPGAGEHDSPPLSAADERAVAMAHAHLRGRVALLLATIDRTRPDGSLVDEAETKLRHAFRLKRRLLRSTVPLIRRTLRRHAEDVGRPGVLDDGALLARCLAAASAAVDAYVPSRTGRLAAPVSLALAREIGVHGRRGGALPAMASMNCETPQVLAMPPHVRRGVGVLALRERDVVLARYGTPALPPMSFAEISAGHGVSVQAWWAVYRRAAKAGALVLSR
jgi:RNA polymerase primary sigma factor